MSSREFTTAPSRPWSAKDGPPQPPTAPILFDPLRYCIFTTLGLLAWIVGPEVVVSLASAAGLIAYWTARRAGLVKSRCILGDTRLVMAYLALAFLAGIGGIAYRFFH
jgi:hypothetical protein